jgi:hypothetical protein
VYTDAEVLVSTLEDLYKWRRFRTYGIDDPSPNMTPKYRSTAVEYWKKSVSYFINTTCKWIDTVGDIPGIGNVTQLKKVNNLTNAVKKAETRGIGQESVVDRVFTIKEF